MQLLVGDVLLSAACIAYYGAFPGDYRQELVSGWVDKCKEFGIPVSPDCTLRGTLASPIQVLPTCCIASFANSQHVTPPDRFYGMLTLKNGRAMWNQSCVRHTDIQCAGPVALQ